MSDKLLRALMQLFAILGKIDGFSSNSRGIVLEFLKEQLNQELSTRYINLYTEFVEQEKATKEKRSKKNKPGGLPSNKRASVRDSLKILHICSQINEELTQKQKFIVLIRLLEFLINDSNITDEGTEILDTISTSFNISEADLDNIKTFVFDPDSLVKTNENLLLVNDIEQEKNPEKHLFIKGVLGNIYIYHVKVSSMYFLRYEGKNELYLNGQIIKNNKSYVFAAGASIRGLKGMQTIYYSDVSSIFSSNLIKNKLYIKADNISYKFRNKQGIYPFSFSETSGKLIGIMGASGSGKSTLLNLLNGNFKPSTGNITINGIDLYNDSNKLEGIIGYVSQDDLLIEELTVYENLYLNAELCFDGYQPKVIEEKVDKILFDTGLYEIRNLKVGSPLDKKISGGQRKRLNIALELIREPEILFVDEPTSGLSSSGSLQIMDLLKEQTLKGKLVFTVIHQPSSEIFLMFNNLLLLDNGFPVYYGHPSASIFHFKSIIHHASSLEGGCIECGNVNSEEIFDIIESKIVDEYGELTNKRKVPPKEWYARFIEYHADKKSDLKNREETLAVTSYRTPSIFKQIKVFIKRDVLSKKSNLQYLLITFLQAPILAILLGFLIKNYPLNSEYVFRENDNIPAYLFMSVIVSLFLGLSLSAQEIFKDRKILKREEFLNLSWFSYLASKCGILFTISAVQIVSFVVIANWILEVNGLNFEYWLLLFSAACVANTMGLIISSSFNSAVNIYILVPILLIPQLLLSGVIVKFDKLNPNLASPTEIPLAGEIMASRWAFEALAVNQFKNNDYEKNFFDLHQIKSESEFKKNFWVPTLNQKIDFCLGQFHKVDKTELNDAIQFIYKEINTKIDNSILNELFGKHLELILNYPNKKSLLVIKDGLQKINEIYIKRVSRYSKAINEQISFMQKTMGKKEFLRFRNANENIQLTQLVKKTDDTQKSLIYENEIVQKTTPIFQEGTGNMLKAPFFAYSKKLFGETISTFWANVIVLWLIVIIQFIILYMRGVRRLLIKFSRIANKFGVLN